MSYVEVYILVRFIMRYKNNTLVWGDEAAWKLLTLLKFNLKFMYRYARTARC